MSAVPSTVVLSVNDLDNDLMNWRSPSSRRINRDCHFGSVRISSVAAVSFTRGGMDEVYEGLKLERGSGSVLR
jgi:hypothetical protein